VSGTTTATAVGQRVVGDTAASISFEAAVGPLYPDLVRRLVVVLRNRADAEDVAQEAYFRAFRSWNRFDGSDVRAWLWTIALRLAFNDLRATRRRLDAFARLGRARLSAAAPRHPAADWTDAVDGDLWAALGRLDARVRSAVVLTAVDGYSHREAADILGVPEGTVASWISRARRLLRRDLSPATDVGGRADGG
jgi:RNA polymerase sigma-70 factor (ECF subfamily)